MPRMEPLSPPRSSVAAVQAAVSAEDPSEVIALKAGYVVSFAAAKRLRRLKLAGWIDPLDLRNNSSYRSV